jgi:hypothetical protein
MLNGKGKQVKDNNFGTLTITFQIRNDIGRILHWMCQTLINAHILIFSTFADSFKTP